MGRASYRAAHRLFLCRILQARPLKRALASSGSELALIVSDYVYGSVVCRYPTLAGPDAFRPARFQVKYTRARAWICSPAPRPPPSPPQSRCT
jgi:hypothetical protein